MLRFQQEGSFPEPFGGGPRRPRHQQQRL